MDDEELARFLHLTQTEAAVVIPKISPGARALYERMQQIAIEAELWTKGLGPKPGGVLLDTVRGTRHRKVWK
jgi:hypothetical protein